MLNIIPTKFHGCGITLEFCGLLSIPSYLCGKNKAKQWIKKYVTEADRSRMAALVTDRWLGIMSTAHQVPYDTLPNNPRVNAYLVFYGSSSRISPTILFTRRFHSAGICLMQGLLQSVDVRLQTKPSFHLSPGVISVSHTRGVIGL